MYNLLDILVVATEFLFIKSLFDASAAAAAAAIFFTACL